MLGIGIIRPLASIIWQLSRCRGIRETLENAPASPDPSYLATQSHITLPRHSEVHDRTMMAPIVASFGRHISAICAIQLTKLSKHLRRPSTSTAIHPELPSLLPFFRISHCVTDTRDDEIRQFDHFDCLSFIEYCLRYSHPATHAL